MICSAQYLATARPRSHLPVLWLRCVCARFSPCRFPRSPGRLAGGSKDDSVHGIALKCEYGCGVASALFSVHRFQACAAIAVEGRALFLCTSSPVCHSHVGLYLDHQQTQNFNSFAWQTPMPGCPNRSILCILSAPFEVVPHPCRRSPQVPLNQSSFPFSFSTRIRGALGSQVTPSQ